MARSVVPDSYPKVNTVAAAVALVSETIEGVRDVRDGRRTPGETARDVAVRVVQGALTPSLPDIVVHGAGGLGRGWKKISSLFD